MAELILTDEERAAETWFELDDAVVGMACKNNGASILDAASQARMCRSVACSYMLIGHVLDGNADELKMRIVKHSRCDEPTGDWEVIVRRVKPRKET